MSPHQTLYSVFYCIAALTLMPVQAPILITVRECEVESIWGVEGTHSVSVCVCVWKKQMIILLTLSSLSVNEWMGTMRQGDQSHWSVCELKGKHESYGQRREMKQERLVFQNPHSRISAAGCGRSIHFFTRGMVVQVLHNTSISKPMIWWNVHLFKIKCVPWRDFSLVWLTLFSPYITTEVK